MSKKLVRRQTLAYRKLLSEEQYSTRNQSLLTQFLSSEFMLSETFHVFLPIKRNKEVDTWMIVKRLATSNKKIIISSTDFEQNSMSHFWLEKETNIEENEYGIPEPKQATKADIEQTDCILIPLVAWDSLGSRIGYGKGYYDSLIHSIKKSVIKVGLSLSPGFDSFPFMEEHDQNLDFCVTPFEVIKF